MSKQALKHTTKSKALSVVSTKQQNLAERHEQIAREAYLAAEKRNFQGGDPMLDWLEAEEKVDHNYETH